MERGKHRKLAFRFIFPLALTWLFSLHREPPRCNTLETTRAKYRRVVGSIIIIGCCPMISNSSATTAINTLHEPLRWCRYSSSYRWKQCDVPPEKEVVR